MRQNLALVVGLQGRFAEAETIVKGDLPAEEAAANVAYLRQMLSRKDNPRIGARTGRWWRSTGRLNSAVNAVIIRLDRAIQYRRVSVHWIVLA